MIEEFHTIIATYIISGILLVLALCFFFLSIPKKEELGSYRVARRGMGYAYLFYVLVIFVEYFSFSPPRLILIAQTVIIVIACSQAMLFTYTLITLIDIHFVTRRRIIREILPLALFVAGSFVVFLTCAESCFRIFFYLFVAFYIQMLIRYTILFRKQYRYYLARMDNFFSDGEYRRLQWVSISFYAALIIGMLAIAYALFPLPVISLSYMIVVAVFYAVFGVRFINYAFDFHTFETAIAEKKSLPSLKETEPEESDRALMILIDRLVGGQQLYKKPDISIDEIASVLKEKHYAISTAINRCRKINFKAYINEYRVREAMRILSEDKLNTYTIEGIASDAGFGDRSTFYRVFKKHTGISPYDFKTNGQQLS